MAESLGGSSSVARGGRRSILSNAQRKAIQKAKRARSTKKRDKILRAAGIIPKSATNEGEKTQFRSRAAANFRRRLNTSDQLRAAGRSKSRQSKAKNTSTRLRRNSEFIQAFLRTDQPTSRRSRG